jgi:hypothetical protein
VKPRRERLAHLNAQGTISISVPPIAGTENLRVQTAHLIEDLQLCLKELEDRELPKTAEDWAKLWVDEPLCTVSITEQRIAFIRRIQRSERRRAIRIMAEKVGYTHESIATAIRDDDPVA